MNKIFLSHINEEAPIAKVLKDWIEDTFAGQCEVFVSSDKSRNPPGSRWLDLIDVALTDSKAFIVLCSPDSLRRPWINFETGCGWIKRVPVIPLCHSGQKSGQLPMPISLFQGVELESAGFVTDLLTSLAQHLGIARVPRIDQVEMKREISEAIAKVSITHNQQPDSSESGKTTQRLDNIAIEILATIMERASDELGTALSQIRREINIEPSLLNSYLRKLRDEKLIELNAQVVNQEYYLITRAGRHFLRNG
jgi:predicted transcriptional regulator